MLIDSLEAIEDAHREVTRLITARQPDSAIGYAEALEAGTGHAFNVKQLRALAYTDGGKALEDRTLVERGISIWEELDPTTRPTIAYNRANAELAIWQIAVNQNDLPAAWENDRKHLHAARSAFEAVGADTTAPRELRLQSLTNAGNAYDMVGRDLDALACWDAAIAIDPRFGMALGNRGISLAAYAPYMRGHSTTVRAEAAIDLDAALAAQESVLRFGEVGTLERFQAARIKLGAAAAGQPPQRQRTRWLDPHFEWCRRHELFLHVSHACLREETNRLDPLTFRGFTVGLTEADQQRKRDLVDAFNAVKEDYVSARYATWLAIAKESPIRDHSTAVSARAVFLDSLTYARFGIRTGLAVQAFSAATNVLDKVAGIVHLYFGTGRRVRDVYFGSIARPSGQQKGGAPKPLDPEVAAALSKPEQNVGLIALCDLSCDLERDTALSRLIDRRHTATHRFLVAHTEMAPPSTDRIERLRWPRLVAESVTQLQAARAALVYLVRAIDRHEAALKPRPPAGSAPMIVVPRLELPVLDTSLVEYE